MEKLRKVKPAGRRPTALTLAICGSLTLTVLYNGGVPMPPRALTEAIIVLLPLLGVMVSYTRLRGRVVPAGAIVISTLFLVVVAISGMLNGTDSTLFVMLAPGIIAVAFSLGGGLLNEADFRVIGRWLIFLGVVQLVIAIADVQLQAQWAQSLSTQDGFYRWRANLVIPGIGRAAGTTGHPIMFGFLCSVGALLALNPHIVRSNLWRAGLILGLGYGVLLSGSRSSVAALFAAAIVYALHNRSNLRRGLRVLVVLALIPVAWFYVSSALTEARTISAFSLDNRLQALPRFLETLGRPFPEAMLGEGFRFSLDTVADNQFLTTSGLYGVFGVLVLIAAMIYAIFSPKPIVTGVMALLVIMSLSFDILEWGFSASLFWLLVGMSRSGKMKAADGEPKSTTGRQLAYI